MSFKEENIALFDRYLQGEMSIAERRHFESKLQSNKELYEQFLDYRNLAKGIELAGHNWLKDQFSETEKSISKEEMEPYDPQLSAANLNKKNRSWNIISWLMIIGSIILLIAFLIAVFNLPDLEDRFKHEENQPEPKEESSEIEQDSCVILVTRPYTAIPDDTVLSLIVQEAEGQMTLIHNFTNYNVCFVKEINIPTATRVFTNDIDSLILPYLDCRNFNIYEHPNKKSLIIQCNAAYYLMDDTGLVSIGEEAVSDPAFKVIDIQESPINENRGSIFKDTGETKDSIDQKLSEQR